MGRVVVMFEVAILKRSFEARDFHSLARLSMVVIVMWYVSENLATAM